VVVTTTTTLCQLAGVTQLLPLPLLLPPLLLCSVNQSVSQSVSE
jgi:hypothetical protein